MSSLTAQSPLLAVLLVTSSSRGPSLSFRYPRRPRLEKRYSKVRYLVANKGEEEAQTKEESVRVDHDGDDARAHVQEDEMNDDFDGGSMLSEDLDDGSNSDSSSSEGDDDTHTINEGTMADEERSEMDAYLSSSRREEIEVASSAGGASATTKEAAASAAAEHLRKRRRAYEQYLGYDCDILASLLAPKRELCHQKFELVIDDLAFVGHPVCVDKDGRWDTDVQGDPETRGREAGRRTTSAGYRVGSPGADGGPSSDTVTGSRNATASTPMTLFHFVLVLDRPDPSPDLPALDLTSWLQIFYDNIAFKMTAALFAEEIRCHYVTRECEKISTLRDRCMDDGQSYSSFLTHANHLSSLARSLQQIQTSISLSSNAFVTINDSIDAHLQLPPMLRDPGRMMKMADIETPIDVNDAIFSTIRPDGNVTNQPVTAEQVMYEGWNRTTGPFLLPWKTLLLLHEHHDHDRMEDEDNRSDITSRGDKGIEAWARRLTSLLRPTLDGVPTLADAAELLGWSLEQDVYPMVRHLIYYREARVIDVPRIQNYYAVSPLFDLATLSRLSTSWGIRFPALPPLPSFLATLSSALKPFSLQLSRRDQRQLCLDTLIWLLRHEVVVQMHVRLRLVASEACKRRAAMARNQERDRILRKRHRIAERKAKEEEEKATAQAQDTEEQADAQGSSRRDRSTDTDLSQSAPAFGAMQTASAERPILVRGRTRDRSSSPAVPGEPIAGPSSETSAVPSALSATRPDLRMTQGATSHRNASIGSAARAALPDGGRMPGDGELRFERRPVLRSRSPSRLLGFTSTAGAMAGTPSSLRSGGGGSRPTTPNDGRGRIGRPKRESSLAREAVMVGPSSVTSDGLQRHGSSHAKPPTTILAAGRIDRRSRSPSRARLRVTGFGEGEEVHLDRASNSGPAPVDADEDGEVMIGDLARSTSTRSAANLEERRSMREDMRRLSLVGEEREAEGEGTNGKPKRQARLASPKGDHASDQNDADSTDKEEDDADDLYLTHDIEYEPWETHPIASIIAEPSRASGEENEWIASMVEGKETRYAERIYQLLPFLNGKHTVDEIVYRLEWRRKELRAVLSAFKEDILTFVHP